MRSPFLLPLYFVSVFLIFLLCFTLVAMVGEWVGLAPQGAAEALDVVLARSPTTVENCLAVALLPAVLFTSLRAARNPVSRPFSLLLPAATIFCLLYFGPMALRLASSPEPSPAAPSPSVLSYLRPGVLTADGGIGVSGRILLVRSVEETVEGASLADAVVVRGSPADSRLTYHARGSAAIEAGVPTVRFPGEVIRLPTVPLFEKIVKPADTTASLLGDVAALSDELRRASASSEREAIFLCLGLSLFLWCSSFVVRLTRWPLLSFALLALLWRLALTAIRFVVETLRPALADALPPSGAAEVLLGGLPAFLLFLAGLFCLGVDVLFVRFDFWTREIEA